MSVQAFDIALAGNLSTLNDKQSTNTNITCLEVCGNFIYVGCKDGSVLRCGFQKMPVGGQQAISIQRASSSHSLSGSVSQIKAISALSQLLVLSDDTLHVLDLESLIPAKNVKFRNVSSFCLNENPLNEDPFTVEICVASRRKLQYVYLMAEQAKTVREFSTNAAPSTLAMDGSYICYATGLEYFMLDCSTGDVQQLFSRDSSEQIALIHRVSKGEFLLCGPSGLGVFVSTQGFSEKPPINFPSSVTALAYHHPYVMAASAQGVSFFSIIDQQSKQAIAISNVRCLVNGDGQVFASTSIDLFALLPISWEIQLENLLRDNRVEEALQLATNAHISSSAKVQHQLMLQRLEKRVALQRLSAGSFAEAMELFETCNVDPREVIKLNLEEMFPNEDTRDRAQHFLLDFLQRWRVKSLTIDQKQAVDGALLDYLVKNDADGFQLLDLVTDCDTDPMETRSLLQCHNRFHCLATYYASRQEWENALNIWARLVKAEIQDPHFPGNVHMADQLVKSGDVALIWRFGKEILNADQEAGARVFIGLFRSPMPTLSLKPGPVVDYLANFPLSLRLFLDFLINEKKDDDPTVHTQLALLYIEEITKWDPQRNSPGQRMTVNKLRSLLRTSQKLDLARLSDVLKSPRFPHEYAIVCGRLGHHSAAIKIFIEQLKDFEAAEEYCACVDDAKAWNCLLMACVAEPQGAMFDRMTDLLRRRPDQFDVPAALRCLPDATRFDVIAPFVSFAVREALHEKRMKKIEKALCEIDSTTSRHQLIKLESESFSLLSTSYCCVCKKKFELTDGFVRYPNGVMTHSHCASNLHICPITGHLFQIETNN